MILALFKKQILMILNFLKRQALLIGLILALIISIKLMLHYKSEYKRTNDNQQALLIQNKNSARELLLTKSDFKEYINSNNKIKKLLKDSLKISLRKIKNLQEFESKYKLELNLKSHDTIIRYRGTKKDTSVLHEIKAKAFKWNDKWTSISGFYNNDNISINIKSVDSIYLTLFWERKGRFLPFLFGRKVYRAKIVNTNPHNKIILGKQIKVIHRKILE